MSFKQIYPGVSRDKRNMYSSYFVHKGRYCQNTEVVISFFFFFCIIEIVISKLTKVVNNILC